MATPTWPTTLPQFVKREGYAEAPGENTIETPVDAGPAKSRRRFTADTRRFTVVVHLTQAEFDDVFEPFWRDTLAAGSLPFNWVHPRTQASTLFSFRKPHWSLQPLSADRVAVTLTLERLS